MRRALATALAAAVLLVASSCDLGTQIKTASPTEVEGLTGTLVGPDGAPVSGAWVKVYAPPAATTAKAAAWATAGAAAGPALDSIRTNASGTFNLPELADGTYNLAAAARRNDTALALFLQGVVVSGRTNLGIDTLKVSGSLVVHLDAGGSSLVGALCFITASPWTSVSDTAGNCRLAEIPPGGFRISVSYSGGVLIEFGDLVVTSGGSSLDSVTVPTPRPDEIPTLLSPAANATGVSTSSANFSWMGVESALYYRLQIAADSLFTNRIVDDTVSASVTAGAMSRHASGLADGTGYFWRVVAVMANQTTISAWRWFSTSVVKPPDPAPGNSVSVIALQDAEILAPAATQAGSGMHDNSNFGESPDIGVGVYDINTVARGLVQFRIPAGFQASDIKRAVIRLQVGRWITKNVHPDSVRIRAHELLRSWKEGSGMSTDGTPNSTSIDGVTGLKRFWGSQNGSENWNQRLVGLDGIDAAPMPTSEAAQANGYIGSWEFDVTDLAKKWATDSSSNFGVVFLTDVPESDSMVEDYPIFHSKDGSVPDAYKPQLILTPAGNMPDTTAVTDSTPLPVGTTWTSRSSGLTTPLYGAAWNDSLQSFVAVGNSGFILTSPDGVTWTAPTSGTNQLLYAVATRPGGSPIAVGAGGTILIASYDMTAWTSRPSGTASGLYAAAGGPSLYVAVGASGTILTSADGATWTARNSGTTNGLYAVAARGNGFIATGANGTVLVSPDGITWTPQTSGTTVTLYSVTSSGGLSIAAGAGGTIVTATDSSAAWTSHASGTTKALYAQSSIGNQRVIVGENGVVLTSPNGTDWTSGNSGTTEALYGVARDGTRLVAVGAGGTVLTSDIAAVMLGSDPPEFAQP